MRFIALILILIAPTWATAEYIDERFSIDGMPTYVFITDQANDGCWTNIGEVRQYVEDKLTKKGALIVDGPASASIFVEFRILAQRWASVEWCYGSLHLSVVTQALSRKTGMPFNVAGRLYSKSAIDIEPKNFNIVALTWLGNKLKELD